MRRIHAAAAVVISLSTWAVFQVPGAGAAPSPSATVTLQCDRGVSATAHVNLLSAGGNDVGQVDIWCGPGVARNRSSVAALEVATTADITTFVTNGPADCATTVQLPASVDCPADGRTGAKLSIR